jgi:hypothetical protein
MALTGVPLSRRRWLLSLPALAHALMGCAGTSAERHRTAGYRELFHTPPADSGRIVVFLPDTLQAGEVWHVMRDELAADFQLIGVLTRSPDDVQAIAEAFSRHRPSALVLMNNTSVAAYGEYQRRYPTSRFPPAVIVMSSFLDGPRRPLQAVTGISYEVPLITVVTNLRKLIASPIERVGVVHRGFLRGFVERQAQIAQVEQIRLAREELSNSPNASELKHALRKLKERADALWVLNDDRLLTPRLILDGWLPAFEERPWVPTIVGVASLVSPGSSFGTFAVLPDHAALGVQAADLVFAIAQNGWTLPKDSSIQLPLSTTTTIDLASARERFALREQALAQVDRILE